LVKAAETVKAPVTVSESDHSESSISSRHSAAKIITSTPMKGKPARDVSPEASSSFIVSEHNSTGSDGSGKFDSYHSDGSVQHW
jgi:hypothetical protein